MPDTRTHDVKASAKEVVDSLPDSSTWDDVIYRMYVRQKIEEGLADAEAGNLISTDEVRKRLGHSK